MNKSKYAQDIREYEIGHILPFLPRGASLLEIGGGAGWQADYLTKKGFQVKSIDVQQSKYTERRIFPVQIYNGKTIPFEDNTFDVIFSSNVLEHIPHCRQFQSEIHRVLKPGGTAIHILPSASWRFWTSVAFYPSVCGKALHVISGKLMTRRKMHFSICSEKHDYISAKSKVKLMDCLRAPKHGILGSSLTQLYYFSRFYWRPFFEKTGWHIERMFSNHLIYTGYGIFKLHLPLSFRRKLSCLTGSACNVFLLKKKISR